MIEIGNILFSSESTVAAYVHSRRHDLFTFLAAGTKLYKIDGSERKIEVCDLDVLKWNVISDIQNAQEGCCVVTLNGFIYFIGGEEWGSSF